MESEIETREVGRAKGRRRREAGGGGMVFIWGGETVGFGCWGGGGEWACVTAQFPSQLSPSRPSRPSSQSCQFGSPCSSHSRRHSPPTSRTFPLDHIGPVGAATAAAGGCASSRFIHPGGRIAPSQPCPVRPWQSLWSSGTTFVCRISVEEDGLESAVAAVRKYTVCYVLSVVRTR